MTAKMSLILLLFSAITACAAEENLRFTYTEKGMFSFDTGVIKGTLRADQESQGMPVFIDVASGIDLAYGGTNPGILSFYRIFTTDKRWGDTARNAVKYAEELEDGAAKIHWPMTDQLPFSMTAIYRWKTSNILDLEFSVQTTKDLPDFEVFLSSYVNKNFKGYMYTKDPLHEPLKDRFLAVDASPLVEGTYLAFPRDAQTAQLYFGERWALGMHPVQFSVAQYMAKPVYIKRDTKNNFALVWMARPESCFGMTSPYNMDPPDGVAGHFSVYQSFFGEDVPRGQTVHARLRLVVTKGITDQDALDLYENFIEETKNE